MKTKLFFVALALVVFSASAVSALDWTLTNRFGGDSDNVADNDFFVLGRNTETFNEGQDDEYTEYRDGYSAALAPSDRLQFDFSAEKIRGRIRMTYQAGLLNGRIGDDEDDFDLAEALADNAVRLRGYAQFNPIKYVGLTAGSEFWSVYGLSAANLVATEDTRGTAKMATSGFGLIGDVAGLKIMANFAGDSFNSTEAYPVLNFGLDYNAFGLFTIGAAIQNAINDTRTVAAYAGLTCVDNLTLNLGFHWNAGASYFPARSTMMASLSAGYNFANIGLGIYADFASAFNEDYYVGGDTTVATGTNDGIPMYVAGRIAYRLTNNFSLNFQTKVFLMAGAEEQDVLDEWMLYPYVTYSISDAGNIRAGLRFTIEEGLLSEFAIPIWWEYRIASN